MEVCGCLRSQKAPLPAAPVRQTEQDALDAIRDSRIASHQMSFGTLGDARRRMSATVKLSARLRGWREKNDFSQSEAAMRLQISKRTLQEWEQDRAEPRGLASAAIEKAIRG